MRQVCITGTKEAHLWKWLANIFANDKKINATLKTDYDETIGNINIIPQDVGRVILNLPTNAFYIVNEKNR